MRKVLLFFGGLILFALMGGVLMLAGAIYDTGNKTTVVSYFFQPDDMPFRRPGAPESPEDVDNAFPGANVMRNKLIQKYITEFFYVMPDMDDFNRRFEGRTALRGMSYASAFAKWQEVVAPEIQKMIEARQMRTVSLVDVIPADEFLRVNYQLKTWLRPNDMESEPEISYGTIYMNMVYEPGMREEIRGMTKEEWLESGMDPAAVFRFIVYDVTIPENQTGR